MLSHRPRDAHFLRFSNARPHAGHTLDCRAPRAATVPERWQAMPIQSPCVPRTCFQNFVKLANGMPGIG